MRRAVVARSKVLPRCKSSAPAPAEGGPARRRQEPRDLLGAGALEVHAEAELEEEVSDSSAESMSSGSLATSLICVLSGKHTRQRASISSASGGVAP